MKSGLLITGGLVVALLSLPVTPASAHEFHHGGGHWGPGPVVGLFGLAAAAVVGVATIVTYPIRAVADATSEPAPPPVYAAPAPAYYPGTGYAPNGYAYPYPRRQVVYAYPQPYPAPQAYYYPAYQ